MPPQLHVATFATHSEGMFDDLMADARRHGVDISVLGMGTPWTGFMQKVEAFRDFASRQPPDHLVMFVDGFDSRLRGGEHDIVQRWQQLGSPPILFSRDANTLASQYVPRTIARYLKRKVYGDSRLNSGMIIGRSAEVARLAADTMDYRLPCKEDDQCAYSKTVATGRHAVVIDDDSALFNNVDHNKRPHMVGNAVVYSFPGTLTLARSLRALLEYGKFLVPEIIVLCVAVSCVAAAVVMRSARAPGRRQNARRRR